MLHDTMLEAAEILLSMQKRPAFVKNNFVQRVSERDPQKYAKSKKRYLLQRRKNKKKIQKKRPRKKCLHGRQEYYCRECGGRGICYHGRQKSICLPCRGNGICEHLKVRSRCKKCEGKLLRKHKK